MLQYCAATSTEGEEPEEATTDALDLSSLEESSNGETDGELASDEELLLDSLRDPIDRLFRLSTRIRSPTSRYESSKALRYEKKDPDSNVDFFDAVETFDYDCISSIFLQHRKSNAIEILPTVEPSDSRAKDDTDDHVWEPIRSLLTQHKAELANNNGSCLVRRFAMANVRRRRRFAYWKKHREKLAQHTSTFVEQAQRPRPETPILHNVGSQIEATPGPADPAGRSITTATRLDLAQLAPWDNRTTASVSEYAPSTQVNMDVVDFPSAPKHVTNEKFFECPYCYTLCSTVLLSKIAWK